jgi:hypothetical protein
LAPQGFIRTTGGGAGGSLPEWQRGPPLGSERRLPRGPMRMRSKRFRLLLLLLLPPLSVALPLPPPGYPNDWTQWYKNSRPQSVRQLAKPGRDPQRPTAAASHASTGKGTVSEYARNCGGASLKTGRIVEEVFRNRITCASDGRNAHTTPHCGGKHASSVDFTRTRHFLWHTYR